MKITALSVQLRDPNRVNVSIDGKYRFSLDIYQVADLGIKVGQEYDEQALTQLITESQFGKLYARALEYSLMRPRSVKEVRDYLYKKTLVQRYRSRKTREIKERQGVSREVTERVLNRLVDKGYVDDVTFAKFWIENRHQKKGTSSRKLQAELSAKGVDKAIIEQQLSNSDRNDTDELQKMIIKKRSRYPDNQKLMQYLARQGFAYDDIKQALEASDD